MHPVDIEERQVVKGGRKMRKAIEIAVAALALGLIGIAQVFAADQTVDATLTSSVTMDTAPSAAVGTASSPWVLNPSGTTATSGGSISVTANVAYYVKLASDKAKLSEWVTSTSSYVAGGKTLANALTITPTATAGTAAGTAVTTDLAVVSPQTLITGLGGGTDSFNLTLSQVTLLTDKSLPSGSTYHMKLTYTATAAL